jgi:hypothetical protein
VSVSELGLRRESAQGVSTTMGGGGGLMMGFHEGGAAQGGFDAGARRMGLDTLRAHGHPGSGTDRARGPESNYAPVRAGPIPTTGSGSSYAAQQAQQELSSGGGLKRMSRTDSHEYLSVASSGRVNQQNVLMGKGRRWGGSTENLRCLTSGMSPSNSSQDLTQPISQRVWAAGASQGALRCSYDAHASENVGRGGGGGMNGHLKMLDRGQGQMGGVPQSGLLAAGEHGRNGDVAEDSVIPRMGVFICYIHISYCGIYVCLYVCMYVYVYVCMYGVCVCVCVCVCVFIYVYDIYIYDICMCVCVYIYMYIFIYIYIIYIYIIYVCVCVCVCIYIYHIMSCIYESCEQGMM